MIEVWIRAVVRTNPRKIAELERFESPAVPRVGDIWDYMHYQLKIYKVEWYVSNHNDGTKHPTAMVWVDGRELQDEFDD